MKKELKPIPKFNSEEDEFEFWSKADSTEYLDPEGWRRVPAPKVPKTPGLHDIILSPEIERQVERLSREKKLSMEEMVRQLVAAGLKQQGLQPGV